jgi:(E)-4-hydroxy-3-methylbut-2-enyl-diphosphate synthase
MFSPACLPSVLCCVLQEVTDQIRTRTGHLPGVSIAVMGCIVNGPGEMADADFG